MCSTFGGAVAECRDRVLDELALGREPQRAVVLALEADGRGRLVVDRRRCRSSEPPRWPGQTSTSSGSAMQPLVQRAEDPGRALARLDREVGAGDVADEQRVAGQDGPGIAAAIGVAEQEGGVLGPVAGRVHRLDLDVAEAKRPAVGERLVRVLGVGELVDVDGRARRPGEPAVSRDVVGVVVGLEHVLDPDAVQPAEPQVGLDDPLRVDHRGDARAGVADQVGGAAQVLVQDLAKEHFRRA